MNFINQLLKNLIKERCILHLKTIFGVLIWLICSYWLNLIRDLDFYYVIDIFRKYAWVIPLKDKKSISIVNAFQIILKESNCKPNSIGFGGLVKLFSSSRRSDRVCLGCCVWDLVWKLFRMQAWRQSVKAHKSFGSIDSSFSTGFQVYLSKCWDP